MSLGPEHGTVGPEQVKEAAKEAVQGLGFNTLVVCGFAFDPHVTEETKRFGNLQVLIARMNPDLSMGGDLLKKTGTGNLFMVFGEPDKAHIAALEHLSRTSVDVEHQDKVLLLTAKDRNVRRYREEGRFSNAPDTKQQTDMARLHATQIPVLMLLRQNGKETDGWRDLPFWWPVIVTPDQAITSVFASATPGTP